MCVDYWNLNVVAPLAGAWIEIGLCASRLRVVCRVAPLAGAWIEIAAGETTRAEYVLSLPSRERGLKSGKDEIGLIVASRSLPSRERGLKYHRRKLPIMLSRSLPSRERGLKSGMTNVSEEELRRSPRGSVD